MIMRDESARPQGYFVICRTLLNALLVVALSGCELPPGPFIDLKGAPAPVFERKMILLAPLAYNEGPRSLDYTNQPPYRGIGFTGLSGESVDIHVRSPNGHAAAWLLDQEFEVIASAGDASDGAPDAHIAAILPRSDGPRLYILALRDLTSPQARMEVTVKGPEPKARYQAAMVAKAQSRLGASPRPYSEGKKPAGAWMRCYDRYRYDNIVLQLCAIKPCDAGFKCTAESQQHIETYCYSFDPAQEGVSCESSGRVICRKGSGCTISDCGAVTDEYQECGAQDGKPSRCFHFDPPSKPLSLPCKPNGYELKTWEGWVPADPACCDSCCETPGECSGSRSPVAWDSTTATCVNREPVQGKDTTIISHRVVGKSFIGPIVLANPDNFQMQEMKFLFELDENPTDDGKVYYGLGYRMRTEMEPTIECKGGQQIFSYIKRQDFHMGFEHLLIPCTTGIQGPLCGWVQGVQVTAFTAATESPSCVTFRAEIGGQPHPWAQWGASIAVGYHLRTIRHTVEATLCCDGTTDYKISGTAFPSHRLFVDGQAQATVTQGTLEELQKIDHPNWRPIDSECIKLQACLVSSAFCPESYQDLLIQCKRMVDAQE